MKKRELERLFPHGFGLKNAVQLEKVLIMENGRNFHPDLVSELVTEFGNAGLVNFDQFYTIWCYLSPMRSKFEHFSPDGGVLTTEKFKMLIQEHLGHTVNSATLDMLTSFYTNLAFDSFVHCFRNLKKLDEKFDISIFPVSWDTYHLTCKDSK